MVKNCAQKALVKVKLCRKWLFGLAEVSLMATITQGAVRCHSARLRTVFAGVVIGILITSTTITLMVKDPRTSELNRLSRDWRVNWEDSVARTLQGLEDGSPKKVSTRKPKISANVNVTVKEKSHPISGPSDVGGSCPTGAKLYTEADVEYCCCGDGCCWDRCTWQDPPKENCLPPEAAWQKDDNTGHFQAMGKGLVSVDNSTSVNKAEIEREIEQRAQMDDQAVGETRPYGHRHPRILCWVMTQPKNHAARDVHIKATWGKRCDKLLFMSTESDESLPAIKLACGGDRNSLWCKTQEAFKYIYAKHGGDFEWFLKADDDTYVVVDNLRAFLSTKDPDDPVHFGCKYKVIVKQGYMSGGAGYVLSKEAVKRFVVKALGGKDSKVCRWQDGKGAEDAEIGRCLMNVGVAAGDSRDELARGRFWPFTPDNHLKPGKKDPNYWYWKNIYYDAEQGPDCCSDTAISFHYVPPMQMYVYEYMIYSIGYRLGRSSQKEENLLQRNSKEGDEPK